MDFHNYSCFFSLTDPDSDFIEFKEQNFFLNLFCTPSP